MPLVGEIVELAAVPYHAQLQKVIDGGTRKHFMTYDAQRLTYAFNRAKAGRACLEVGPGLCDLANMLYKAQLFERLSVIDIRDRSGGLPKAIDFKIMDVADLRFPDNEFDTVYCMEVLEHLDDENFTRALDGLRRVCRRQLIMTVPFLEPMPSKYHLQRFDQERVRALFPKAKLSILLKEPVLRVPWLMIEEEADN